MARAVGTVVGGVVGFMIGGPIGAIAGAGLGYAGAEVIEQMMNPGFDIPQAGRQEQVGLTINKQGTDKYIPVIYGRRFIGGNRIHVTTDSSNNQYLYVKTVLCEGVIGGVAGVYLDDTLVSNGPQGGSFINKPNQSKYMPYTAKDRNNNKVESHLKHLRGRALNKQSIKFVPGR